MTQSIKCIVPIKLDNPNITPQFLLNTIPQLFALLPKNYTARPTALLYNNPSKSNKETPLNIALRNIQDLEWNYAFEIETTTKDAAVIVYFMRHIYNQLYISPFKMDNAIANLKELFKDSDFQKNVQETITYLKKVNLNTTTAVYYFPKKKRLSSLPDACLQEITTYLSVKDYLSLTQACKSIKSATAAVITTNLLKGKLKKDLLHQIFSHDNINLLNKFPDILKDTNLAPLLNKYWSALDCWTHLSAIKTIDQPFIYQHYPLGKALFACIVGYNYNTQTELYVKVYNLLKDPEEHPLEPPSYPSENKFYQLEKKLKNFIETADLQINQFPYNYNMIDDFTKTVYCKGLPSNRFTVGLSYYDIVTKARYYFVNKVQPYLSHKMLAFLFQRGLSYLPNPNCKPPNQLYIREQGDWFRRYNIEESNRLDIILQSYTEGETPQLRIRVDPTNIKIPQTTRHKNIFSYINEKEDYDDSIYEYIEILDKANKAIDSTI